MLENCVIRKSWVGIEYIWTKSQISSRHVAKMLNLSYGTIWNIPKKFFKGKSYSNHLTQILSPENKESRLMVCNYWFTFEDKFGSHSKCMEFIVMMFWSCVHTCTLVNTVLSRAIAPMYVYLIFLTEGACSKWIHICCFDIGLCAQRWDEIKKIQGKITMYNILKIHLWCATEEIRRVFS